MNTKEGGKKHLKEHPKMIRLDKGFKNQTKQSYTFLRKEWKIQHPLRPTI